MNRRGFIGRTVAAIGALCGVTRGTEVGASASLVNAAQDGDWLHYGADVAANTNPKLIHEWNDRIVYFGNGWTAWYMTSADGRFYPKPGSMKRYYSTATNSVIEFL